MCGFSRAECSLHGPWRIPLRRGDQLLVITTRLQRVWGGGKQQKWCVNDSSTITSPAVKAYKGSRLFWHWPRLIFALNHWRGHCARIEAFWVALDLKVIHWSILMHPLSADQLYSKPSISRLMVYLNALTKCSGSLLRPYLSSETRLRCCWAFLINNSPSVQPLLYRLLVNEEVDPFCVVNQRSPSDYPTEWSLPRRVSQNT